MAKLSARGRTEIFRMVKLTETPDDDLCDKRERKLALMSDGTILRHDRVHFRADMDQEAHWHSYGWKVQGKLKRGLSPAEARSRLIERGYNYTKR